MKEKQVFQASSPLRWKTFQWLSRLVIFFLILLVPVVWIAWKIDIKPRLPLFSQTHRKSKEIKTAELSRKDSARYKGIAAFLRAKQHNDSVIVAEKKLAALRKQTKTEKIRAGFYVDWDPQAWFSLQTHINDLNTVIPEWFFIDSSSGKIITQINSDTASYNLMKRHNIKILPILENTDASHSGNFSGELLDKVLRNPVKREQLIN